MTVDAKIMPHRTLQTKTQTRHTSFWKNQDDPCFTTTATFPTLPTCQSSIFVCHFRLAFNFPNLKPLFQPLQQLQQFQPFETSPPPPQ